jgi:predicted AAA+ superfamily ATPase
MYLRKIYSELEEHLAKKQVTVITGLRRVGKSTALKHLYKVYASKNKVYLDLERMENRRILQLDNYKHIEQAIEAMGFDFKKPGLIALDEIQTVKNIPSVVKSLYDDYGTKFVVTGSSSFYLKNHFSESLAGRKKIINMFPLDFEEYLDFKAVKKPNFDLQSWKEFNHTFYDLYRSFYNEYILYGGLPEVALAKNEKDKIDYLKDILQSHIELDIMLLGDISASDNLYKLILLLANRVGSKLDVSKIATFLGVNRAKVNDYILLLEATYLIRLIRPFTSGKDKEITKAPKLYFTDNGLLNLCGQISSGAQFENMVNNQLASQGELNYYERATGTEIDFIFNKKIAVEVKETPIPQDLSQLKVRAEKIGLSETILVGRHDAPKGFNRYLWGGCIFVKE